MVESIIDFCARRRLLVLFVVAVALAGATVAIKRVKLDAIPDLSDPQVVVFTEWTGRSPTLIEDQVTYPIVTKLIGAPHVSDVRGFSMFGMSFVYVVFEEGTDIYWARSRVLEAMGTLRASLPDGVTPRLGPDATGIGWVFQYTLTDRSGQHDLADLRTFQDFTLRYALGSVPGVAEVASVGGYQKQYQVTVDPARLRAYGVSLNEVVEAIRQSNSDVGGRILEASGREYYVRGRGYIRDLAALESIAVRASGPGGTPLLIKDIGSVRFGPDIRRGLLEWNGEGEAVGGIVVMRHGENALEVIERVKKKFAELGPSMPAGVEMNVAYDRGGLIQRAIATLERALIEEAITVSAVIVIFLLHFRSALLPILSLPISVALAFIPMVLLGIPSTIMSLGGIAIAIGATVDAEIVMIEAAHKKLEQAPPGADRHRLLAEAAKEVTPAIFFSLLIIAVAFLPVFTLTGQAGRLFQPLAYTKTFVMLISALLSITFAPALRDALIRGRIRPEKDHPISRFIIRLYEPFVYVALRRPRSTVAIGLLAIASAVPLGMRLGHEFMPPLNEGDLLYMPITLPNISIEEAKRQVALQDRVLRSFPEVESVFGKVGRAETATDPAPITMVETTVRLKPPAAWRTVAEKRWYSGWAPGWLRAALRRLWPERRPLTWDELGAEMNAKMQFPGWTNAWTMPIKTRIDMLSTGVRTPVGIKVFAGDLGEVERVGTALEQIMAAVPGTRSVIYERNLGGLYLDIVPRAADLARFGLRGGDVQHVIETAIGGAPVTETVEGRNRFTVNVRYPQDMRGDQEALGRALVPIPGGAAGQTAFVSLAQVADIRITAGPPMVRDEAGQLTGYVYIDIDQQSRDVGGYVDDAKAAVARALSDGTLKLGSGTYLKWTGQYEQLALMTARMKLVVPLTLLIITLLLYAQFRDVGEVLIILLSIPFALVGSAWLLWLLDYRLSTAVWVGIIALAGLAAQTGIVMIVYVNQAFARRKAEGRINSLEDIIAAHMEGTVQRVRPKLMTVATMLVGLVPLLWAQSSGADVMKRIAAPMVGGLLTSAFLTLEIIPVVVTAYRYEQLLWERLRLAAPARLGGLRRSAIAIAAGAAGAAALGVAGIYVTFPGRSLAGGVLAAALLFLSACASYAVRRPAAKRLVWPA
ncbi:MAG TPA: efflux RND transporter permease subunit [Polyangia bacterium]|nr:efflux RND transporter permease subunit [Polyangia bacterium]